MSSKSRDWFEDWFDSEYYHLLYQNRNEDEAERFMDKLLSYLNPHKGERILDMPCGKGRHALYLHKKGFEVTGADLSRNSIEKASEYSREGLSFAVHDMRDPWPAKSFDYVFNLFTSFGYFDLIEENLKVLLAFHGALKDNGHLVIDFMNTASVVTALVPSEFKTLDAVTFKINRAIEEGVIVKKIAFEDKGKTYNYEERVRALYQVDFLEYFEKSGFKVITTFGSYNLDPYLPESSQRMIFVLQKS